jgi:hypothetical protein
MTTAYSCGDGNVPRCSVERAGRPFPDNTVPEPGSTPASQSCHTSPRLHTRLRLTTPRQGVVLHSQQRITGSRLVQKDLLTDHEPGGGRCGLPRFIGVQSNHCSGPARARGVAPRPHRGRARCPPNSAAVPGSSLVRERPCSGQGQQANSVEHPGRCWSDRVRM